MRILVLTQWYPPEPIRLPAELAETLSSRGHDVDVVTAFPNYPSGRLYDGYRLRLWLREQNNDIRVTRVWLYPDHSASKYRRIANYLSFALSAGLLGPFLVKRPDVIYVYGSPYTTAIAGMWWRFVWRRPMVFHVLDMWPEGLSGTGMLNNQLALRAVGRFARFVYSRSARIIACTPGFGRNLAAKGVPNQKTDIIQNWVDDDLYRPVPVDPAVIRQHDLEGRFVVMYAGAIGGPQGLDVVLDAADTLRDRDDIVFLLVGEGVDRQRLIENARERGLENVRFPGLFPPEAMPQLFAAADVLLVHLRDEEIFRITIPHKIFSYMASGKPVLCGVSGDAANVVKDAGAGVAFPPGDSRALAQSVRVLAVMPRAEREALGRAGRRAVAEKYNRATIVTQIEKVLSQAAEGAASGRNSPGKSSNSGVLS